MFHHETRTVLSVYVDNIELDAEVSASSAHREEAVYICGVRPARSCCEGISHFCISRNRLHWSHCVPESAGWQIFPNNIE